MAIFASRGRIASYDDETFVDQSWASSFIGHGLLPRSYDPLVDTVPEEEQMAKFQSLLQTIAKEVTAMPTVREYLAATVQAS
jgi:tryptophan halogenase